MCCSRCDHFAAIVQRRSADIVLRVNVSVPCKVQRRPAIVIFLVDCRAVAQKRPHNENVATQSRVVQRRIAMFALCIDMHIILIQQRDNFVVVAFECRIEQRFLLLAHTFAELEQMCEWVS